MGSFKVYSPSQEKIEQIKEWAYSLEALTPFLQFPHESSFVMSHTLVLEVGGPNDNLAKHIFNSETGQKLEQEDLLAEIVENENLFGVRIFSQTNSLMEIRHKSLSNLCQVSSSEILIFPIEIANRLAEERIEPVLVKEWLIRAIFSDFNPHTSDYRSQMSELLHNDAFLYSKLVSEKKMVFQSLHDVIEHATDASGMAVIDELLKKIQQLKIKAQSPKVLKRFPSSIESVLMMARKPEIETRPQHISEIVNQLVQDLYAFTQ